MNEFIKNSIMDRLRELGEEKEFLDTTIKDSEANLAELKSKQLWLQQTIIEVQEFLNVNKTNNKTVTKKAKISKEAGQE